MIAHVKAGEIRAAAEAMQRLPLDGDATMNVIVRADSIVLSLPHVPMCFDVPADVIEPGCLSVPARVLRNYLLRLDDGPLFISADASWLAMVSLTGFLRLATNGDVETDLQEPVGEISEP